MIKKNKQNYFLIYLKKFAKKELISFGQALVLLWWSFDHYHNYQAPIAKLLKAIDCKRNQTLIRMAYCLLLPHFIVTSPKCAFY